MLDSFAERVEEILNGGNLMNCKLCKYREQILGFEADVGAPQESHHHHVEGIGTGGEGKVFGLEGAADHRHDHGHTHDHGHGHHHHHHRPYPHADHPHGPRSLKKARV